MAFHIYGYDNCAWSHKFRMQVTIHYHGLSMYSGYYSTSVNCSKAIYCRRQRVWNDWYQNSSPAYVIMYQLIWAMGFGPEQKDGSLITLMAPANPFHPSRSRSGNKSQKQWIRRCVFPWWSWFWSENSIHYWIHIMYQRCILNNWNKLSQRDIQIPRIGVAMAMRRIMRFCFYFMLGFNCISQLYSSGFSIS